MRLPLSIFTLVASVLVLVPRVADAQDDPRKAQAESVFAEGLKLHDANHDGEALAKYRQAYGIYPTPNILFAVARLEQVLGQSLAAVTHFREALKSPLLHPRNRELGKTYIAELEKKLARVILVGPAGLRVTIAGKEHRLPVDGVIDVEPGSVAGHAEQDGRTYAGRVDTLAGSEAILELKPVQSASSSGAAPAGAPVGEQPPPSGGEPSNATRNVLAGTLAAVGVVGLGVGLVFSLKAESQISDATTYRDSVAGGPCSTRALPTCDRYASMLDDIKSTRDVSTVAFVGGAVFLAGAGAVFFAWPKRSSSAWAQPVFVGNGAALRGHF